MNLSSRSLVIHEVPDPAVRAIALTFDDGPSEWTEPILDTLRDHGARATFFVVGGSIAGREETVRRAVREGHEIGNHTATHPDLTSRRRRSIRRELAVANRLIEQALGM